MQDVMDFWNKYELIGSTKSFSSAPRVPRKCRFCERTEPEVSFISDAHALPELLGENNVISYEECDSCNSKFGAYESHLSKFFLPYLTAIGVKGKRRVPPFYSRTTDRKEETRTIFEFVSHAKRSLQLGDLNDYKIDEGNKTLHLSFCLPPHRPIYVYKALVKIALSLLPEKYIPGFRNVYLWILNKDVVKVDIPVGFITVLKRKKFAAPNAELYLAKEVISENEFVPELTLVVSFANITIQIFLPLSLNFPYEQSRGKTPELTIFPAFIWNNDLNEVEAAGEIKYHFTSVDLSPDVSVERDEMLHFKYDSADLNIGKSDANE